MVEVGDHDLSRSYDGDDLEAWALLLIPCSRGRTCTHACVVHLHAWPHSPADFSPIGNVGCRPRIPILSLTSCIPSTLRGVVGDLPFWVVRPYSVA
jgi:hypothetical protein